MTLLECYLETCVHPDSKVSYQAKSKNVAWALDNFFIKEIFFELNRHCLHGFCHTLIDPDKDTFLDYDLIILPFQKWSLKIHGCLPIIPFVTESDEGLEKASLIVAMTDSFLVKEHLEKLGVIVILFPLGVDQESFSLKQNKKNNLRCIVGSDLKKDFFLRSKSYRSRFFQDYAALYISQNDIFCWKLLIEAASSGLLIFIKNGVSYPSSLRHGVEISRVESFKDIECFLQQMPRSRYLFYLLSIQKWVSSYFWKAIFKEFEEDLLMMCGFVHVFCQKENQLDLGLPVHFDFLQKKTIYLASADQMKGILDVHQEIAIQKTSSLHLFMVAGGLSGLHLISSQVESITIFDRNLWALAYARFIIMMVQCCATRDEFFSRLFGRVVQSNEELKEVDHDVLEKQTQFFNSHMDQVGIFIYEQTLKQHFLNSSSFLHAQQVFPYWDLETPVPVRTGYSTTQSGILNTNSWFFGHGWLKSEESFQVVKNIVFAKSIKYRSIDLVRQYSKIKDFFDAQNDIVVFLSNIFDFFPEHFKSWVDCVCETVTYQQKRLFVASHKKIWKPYQDPHLFLEKKLKPFVVGKLVEIVHKKDFGFSSWKREEVVYTAFNETSCFADTYLFHNLMAHAVKEECVMSMLKMIQKHSCRVIIFEHNPQSLDFCVDDTQIFLKRNWADVFSSKATVVDCGYASGFKSYDRNYWQVIDICA